MTCSEDSASACPLSGVAGLGLPGQVGRCRAPFPGTVPPTARRLGAALSAPLTASSLRGSSPASPLTSEWWALAVAVVWSTQHGAGLLCQECCSADSLRQKRVGRCSAESLSFLRAPSPKAVRGLVWVCGLLVYYFSCGFASVYCFCLGLQLQSPLHRVSSE